jgi:hypothetical protein
VSRSYILEVRFIWTPGGVLRLLNDLTIQGDEVSAPNCEPLERQRFQCAEGRVNDESDRSSLWRTYEAPSLMTQPISD